MRKYTPRREWARRVEEREAKLREKVRTFPVPKYVSATHYQQVYALTHPEENRARSRRNYLRRKKQRELAA
jgi:hypothetical protein